MIGCQTGTSETSVEGYLKLKYNEEKKLKIAVFFRHKSDGGVGFV